MPAVKRRYFILIFAVALLLAGWSARLYLAERLATLTMQQAGLEAVTADIQRLALNKAQLSRLSFVLPTSTGRLTLDAHSASTDYQPAELLKGRIHSLEINTLVVHYTRTTETAEAHTEPQQKTAFSEPAAIIMLLTAALNQSMEKYILFDELSIHRLTLHGEDFAALDGKTLSLVSRKTDDALYAELTLLTITAESLSQNQATDLPRLVISRLSKDALEAELGPAMAANNLPAKIKLNFSDTEISGSYQLSPRSMQNWLQAVTGRKDIPVLSVLSDGSPGRKPGDNKSSTINGTVALNFKDSDLWHATLTSAARRLTYASYSADNIALNIKLAYPATVTSLKLKLLDGTTLSADRFSAGDTTINSSRFKLAGELTNTSNHWQYKGSVSTKQLTAGYQSRQLQLADIAADFSANAKQLAAKGRFSPATLPGQFNFLLNHNLSSGAGSVSIKPVTAIDLAAEDDHLAKLLSHWPYTFDLYTGKIKLGVDAAWSKHKDTRLSTDISMQDSGGNVGSILFSGLMFDHKLEILPKVQSRQSSEIRLNTVDSGVTISNISMRLAAKPSTRGPLPRVVVLQSKGELLGGTFTADDTVYDLNRSKNRLLIKLNNIDLAEVVKTQQLDNITATGRLDGTLPVEISKDGINIAHGGITNQINGGTIRYTPKNGTEQLRQNPLTGITLDALKDFRYSDLQADVNYLPDGELTIKIALKGISPELDENRPVHLNINTEQNLVSLLKSLRFAQGVSDSIDARVRRRYIQTHKHK